MTTVPRPNPDFVPPTTFSAVDYYVLSRCDGRASIKEILLMLGGVGDAVDILRRLRREGALLLDGEEAPAPAKAAPPAAPVASAVPKPAAPRADRSRPVKSVSPDDDSGAVIDLGELSDEEDLAMASPVDLPERTKKRIIVARRYIGNYFALLGVDPGVGKRQLKRAYFRFSKEFHPDRYYNQDLGLFGPWLAEIFEASTKAWNILSDSRQRKAYEARLFGRASDGPGTQTREEHAAELFERACDTEIRGDFDQALQLFAAAVRSNPRAAYLSRAARCALRAAQRSEEKSSAAAGDGVPKLSVAEEYAKKAAGLRPKDPSYARLLADVYRAAGRLEDAEATILHAIELNSENDVLMAELSEDLEKVRRSRP